LGVFFGHRLSRFRALTFGGIATFFWLWGGIYYNNHHAPPWLAIGSVFMGGVFGAFAAKQVIVNFGKHTEMAWPVFCLIIVSFGLFAGAGLWLEYHSPKMGPRITFVLATSDLIDTPLELTNNFLTFDDFSASAPVVGCAAIPVKEGQTIIKFRVGLKTTGFMEYPQVTLIMPTNWNAVPDPRWSRIVARMSGDDVEGWQYNLPSPLINSNGALLPTIEITPPLIPKTAGQIGIKVEARDIKPSSVAVNVAFFASIDGRRLRKPVVVKGVMNVDGKLVFSILPEDLTEIAPSKTDAKQN
jgi:hypothetical protein